MGLKDLSLVCGQCDKTIFGQPILIINSKGEFFGFCSAICVHEWVSKELSNGKDKTRRKNVKGPKPMPVPEPMPIQDKPK